MSDTTDISIIKSDKTFEVIQSAVNKMVNMIRPTLGPASNKVIISKTTHLMVVDDGVQIARDFELENPEEMAVIRIIRETAVRTNDRVGDGTTGALIMLQAIINEVSRKSKIDGRKIVLELQKGMSDVKKAVEKSAKKIKTKEELKKVAMISFNDEKIAEMISELYFKLGQDATITIDKSPTMETTVEMSEGVKIDNGYISPYMVINPERMESVLEKPYILITDYRVTETNDILNIMNKMAAENKRELVIICENMEQSALATAVLNKIQGKFLILAIVAPKGDHRKILLEDLALMTGAKMFTESKGDKLETAEVKDFGRAQRFICRQNESIIVGPKGKKADIASAISSLRLAYKNETKEKEKIILEDRLGRFTNSIAVIKVGAPTEQEQKALKYKVEDTVNSVKVAYQHGVLCGAGLFLANLKTSSPILNEALKYPAKQLRENMGLDEELKLGPDQALNVVTGKIGDFMEVGVVDPADVILAGIESAISIASILVTSCGMIVESLRKPSNKE